MHETLQAVNDSTVAGLGRLARFFGFNDVMGRLFGTLLMNPDPMSLDDLAETLKISKGSVSMNMRALERWGMAEEHWVRGNRRKFYRAESDMWKVIRNVLGSRERREVQMALDVLGTSVKKLKTAEHELSEEERALAHYFLARMDDLQTFFQLAAMGLETLLGEADLLDLDMFPKKELK